MIWAPVLIGAGAYAAYEYNQASRGLNLDDESIFGSASDDEGPQPGDPDFDPFNDAVPDRLTIAHQQLVESGKLLLVAGAGALVLKPVLWITTGVIVYKARFLFQEAWNSVAHEKKVDAVVVDSVFMGASLVCGWYTANAVLYAFYRLFNYIALKTEDHSRQRLVDIFAEQPRTVWVERDGQEIEAPFDSLRVGEVIVIQAGDFLPVDGEVIDGVASVDQHLFTGESQLVEKLSGDQVYASTIVVSGRLKVRADQTGAETLAAQIGKVLNETNSYAATVEARGMEVADKAATPMLLLAGAAAIVGGGNAGITALTADFGSSMRVLGPVAVLKHLEATSTIGLYVKDGRSLELLRNVDTLVFDKTGTLTLSEPIVESVTALTRGKTEDEVLAFAAAAEQRLSHPTALAIVKAAEQRRLDVPQADDKHYEIGFGVKVSLDTGEIRVGSLRYMDMEGIRITSRIRKAEAEGHQGGNSYVYVARGKTLIGMIELAPQLRPEAHRVVERLRQYCPNIHIISGDHTVPTAKLAARLGIESYDAEVLPHQKGEIVERLQAEGRSVCFVGDGINDSIALKTAMVSVSFKGASSIATDSAQVVIMNDDLSVLEHLFEASQSLDQKMKVSYRYGMAATVLTLGGLAFFGIGPAVGMTISNGARVLGLLNAMRLPELGAPEDEAPATDTQTAAPAAQPALA